MIKKVLAAAALTAVAFGAQATLNGGVAANQSSSSFIVLSASNVSGGALYSGASVPGVAAVPLNSSPPKLTVGTWLAAGPSNTNNGGGAATVTFATPTAFASFLWGSPDTYNTLDVTTSVASYSYTSADFALVANGNQNFASYLGFNATGGETILSMTFKSPATNAFEASNFSVTPVPEPETYALMLAGLGAIGFVTRRRKSA